MQMNKSIISAVRQCLEAVWNQRQIKNLVRRYWQAIRDHKVAKEILKMKVVLRRLDEEWNFLHDCQMAREREIAVLNTPEIVAQHKLSAANRELCYCAVLLVAILASGYWVISYVLPEWRLAVLAILVTAPIVIHFSTRTLRLTPGFKQRLNVLAVVLAFAVLTGSGYFYMSRAVAMDGESKLQDARYGDTGDLVRLETEKLKDLQSNSRSFDLYMFLAMFFLGLAAEATLGLMYSEAMENRAAAVATLYPYRQLRKIKVALIRNAEKMEAATQRPGILFHDLTVIGLTQEAEEARAEEQRRTDEKRRGQAEAKKTLLTNGRTDDIGWAIRNGFIIFLVLFLLTWLFVARAFPAEAQTLVTGLDLSRSAGVHEEFTENVKALGYVLKNISVPGTRAVVLEIGEQSFGAPVILDRTAPTEVGRFNERFDRWRLQTLKELEADKKSLKPTEKGSDLFGFFARASLIFSDEAKERKRLIVFSDMRQVGRGYNFERSIDDPISIVNKVEQEGLIPDLTGVEVWILGAHTAGMDERQWRKLNDFWAEYLRRSGAKLKMFSPDRRLPQT